MRSEFDMIVIAAVMAGLNAAARAAGAGRTGALVERDRLGAHLLADHGADLIHPLAAAMSMGVGAAEAMRRTPHVHPTLGEVIQAAVQATE